MCFRVSGLKALMNPYAGAVGALMALSRWWL